MLPMRDTYGMSTVSSAFVAVLRSSEGSIGDVTDHPEEMVYYLAIVSMKNSWEMYIVPSSQFLLFQIPSSQFGSLRSCI